MELSAIVGLGIVKDHVGLLRGPAGTELVVRFPYYGLIVEFPVRHGAVKIGMVARNLKVRQTGLARKVYHSLSVTPVQNFMRREATW